MYMYQLLIELRKETAQNFEFRCSVIIATCSPPQLEELAQRLIEHEVSTTR